MEGLTKRVFVLGGALLAYGGLLQFAPEIPQSAVRSALAAMGKKPEIRFVEEKDKTEKWMISKSPKQVGDYKFEPGVDPDVSYRMDDATYAELRPWGIVARRYTNGEKAFDVVLIGSETKDSFHDPRVCFTAQRFEIESENVEVVESRVRGTIPVTIAMMKSEAGRSMTAFFYRGPGGFFASTSQMKMDMFKFQCKTMTNPQGVFYRFIPLSPSISKEEFKQFIGMFLDEAAHTSEGFF